ncbi:MAG TPA: S8 family serine peptidase, partial [Haliscomenobacter sp.]|uniref:S8 family serine peptidase n=1 Tax=Haliscomenobacter sp. TaxID=2717303 RepID=UPI002C0AE4ED
MRLETNQKVDRIRTTPGVKWTSPVLVSRDGEEIAIGQKVCVKLKSPNDVMSLYILASQYENALVRQDEFLPLIYYIELPQESALDILNIANQLAESKTCVWAEPVFHMILNRHNSDDQYYPNQWHLNNTGSNNIANISGKADADIDAPEAWAITRGSASIKIAVIDDGVDLNHPDLKANLLPGYDASGGTLGGAPLKDEDAHGTNCAGLIAAVGNNKIGVTGIAPNCKIIPVRVILGEPVPTDHFAKAINWAWKEGKADILSNSWGVGGELNNITKEAIDAAIDLGRNGKGCPVLFASGNENTKVSNPAEYSRVIAVGAVNMCDERKRSSNNPNEVNEGNSTDPLGVSCDQEGHWGSNYGAGLDIAAPSTWIISTDISGGRGYEKGDYNTKFGGTSASCPIAAGVMALILSVNPNLTEKDARFILESTCDKAGGYSYKDNIAQPNGTWNENLGYGRVNAHQAVLKARNYIGQADDYELSLYAALEVSPNPSNIGQDITVKFNLANTGNKEFSGTVAVALFTENGDFIEFMKTFTVTALPVNNHYVNDRIFDYPNQKPKRRFKIGVFYAPTGVQELTPISPGRFENFITWLNGYALNSNCALPPLIKIASTGYAHFSMSWQEVPGIQSYEIRYRRQGTVDWIELPNWSATTHVSVNKTPCTTYEWQIRSVCASSVGNWSPVQLIKTEGCGDPYCYSYGTSNRSFIQEVNIGSLKVSSGTDYGYANRTNSIITTSAGATLPIKLFPGQNSEESLKEVYWKIWIDYNGDKIFDELVFEQKGDNESSVSGTINIPNGVSGKTRLRVMMSLEEGVDPCDRTANKEVEDYGIDFGASVSCKAPSNLRLLAKDYSWFYALWDTLPGEQQYSWRFKQLGTTEWATDDNWSFNSLIFSGIKPCTEYQLQVRAVCGNTFSDWSPELRFKTDGCDEAYCFSYGFSYNDWIKEVNFAGTNNASSGNNGYINFTSKTPTQVELGKSYPLALSAGFDDNSNGDTYYWNVWIDFNQDNDFNDSGELVFSNNASKQTSASGLQGQVNIPANAKPGKTRMRVALSLNSNEAPCETSQNYREVEDYSVEIVNAPKNLTLSSSALNYDAGASSKSVNITSNTTWTITESLTWLSVSPTSGSNNASIIITCDANNTNATRTGTLSVSGTGVATQTITITQAAGSPSLSVSPTT